ncbi:MAG: C-GCAxxG-C-C family protein [Halanaerobiales bacterium]|nr:C-GCAxxG-C-C family protein [Halanaerobiales bacterium]
MNEKEIQKVIELIKKKAYAAQIRDDLCARSMIYGLSCYFDFIPNEIVNASYNLAGGVGASSGSCGVYVAGQLAIGLKYSPAIDQEVTEESKRSKKRAERKMIEFREIFLDEFGTTLCPEIHKKIFDKSFDFKVKKEAKEFFKVPDHKKRCAKVVKKGAELTARFIFMSE